MFRDLLPWRHEPGVVIDDGSDAFTLPDGRIARMRENDLEGLGSLTSAVLPHPYLDLPGKSQRRELQFSVGLAASTTADSLLDALFEAIQGD